MNELTLTLTGDEVNYIYNLVGQRPWSEANALMLKIAGQVQQQTAPVEMPKKKDTI